MSDAPDLMVERGGSEIGTYRPVARPVKTIRPVFFPNLDALRFFAFFLVYLTHGFMVGGLGDVGVSFFFVLSGFLITYLILVEIENIGFVDVKAFYIRRLLRIWPLYYAVVLFAIVIYPALKRIAGFPGYLEIGSRSLYFLFLGNFDVINLGPGHGAISTNVTWSVCIEEQFYLLWPLLFLVLPKRYYKYVFPAIAAGSLLFRAVHGNDGTILYFHTLSVISDMAIGGLCAYVALNSAQFAAVATPLRKIWIFAVYAAGFALIVFRGQIYQLTVLRPFERLILSFFFAFIVLEQNYCAESLLKLGRLKIVTALGKRTYGLYLLHPIAILAVSDARKLLGDVERHWYSEAVAGTVALALTLLLAEVSYRYYEKPFLRLKQAFAAKSLERAGSLDVR